MYIVNRGISDLLEGAFDEYVATIESSRPGTIYAYEVARSSFRGYRSKARVGDVTPRFLSDYEAWMRKGEKSVTTVGIYCRALRSVLNWLIAEGKLSREAYPFGPAKNRKYEIPTSRNVKKALTLQEIGLIYNYKCEKGSNRERCRDYWMFLYLANGINVKDFCLLRWKDVDKETISLVRSKTVRTKKEVEAIRIVILPEMREIMDRWGTNPQSKTGYVFPHLSAVMGPEGIRNAVQLLVHMINDNMKGIAKDLGIDKPVTTYYARHSFATILKNSGAPVALISGALGHSSLTTTQNYLAGFEDDQLKNAAKALTGFKKGK